MKMTDDEVFAVLDRTERLIDCSGAFGLSEYQCEQRTVDARRKLREVRDYLSARLAADQQKGGGEVAEYQSQVTDKATGKVVHPWSHCGRAAYDAAKGQPHEGSRLRVEYRKLYTTPQPSIPAPASVPVERLDRLETNWRFDDGYLTGNPKIDGPTIHRGDAKKECANELAWLIQEYRDDS